jgi:hypothetical protein
VITPPPPPAPPRTPTTLCVLYRALYTGTDRMTRSNSDRLGRAVTLDHNDSVKLLRATVHSKWCGLELCDACLVLLQLVFVSAELLRADGILLLERLDSFQDAV